MLYTEDSTQFRDLCERGASQLYTRASPSQYEEVMFSDKLNLNCWKSLPLELTKKNFNVRESLQNSLEHRL